ncbi:MAG: thioredoxin family protein [Bacteroidales bacterium]|nr:thioredoxin family protein [Bacteroidales bacterium]MDT8431756.1 thioredoxin family protein [Bacteroidales bacterium]
MKKLLVSAGFLFVLSATVSAQLAPGDEAVPFTLKNVDGKMVSLSDYDDQKGVILVFTCNPCPFSKAYEQRIIQLHKKFAPSGYPVVAINPNDDVASPDDTFEKMQARAAEKNFPFPYLKDATQEIYKAYGATRTPHVFLLDNENGTFRVAYIGAIDNNAMDERAVSEKYVELAIKALENGNQPDPAQVKAIGCTIKARR